MIFDPLIDTNQSNVTANNIIPNTPLSYDHSLVFSSNTANACYITNPSLFITYDLLDLEIFENIPSQF